MTDYFSMNADRKAKQAWALIRRSSPTIKLRVKEDCLWLSVLAFFIYPFHPRFMNTPMLLGDTIYLPKSIIVSPSCWRVLLHQSVHIFDMAMLGKYKFTFAYLWPQILAILSLLGLLGFLYKYLWILSAFVLLLYPLPSQTRLNIERRGYTMTLLLTWYLSKEEFQYALKHIKESFTGSKYYYMASKSQWDEIYREWSRIPQLSKYLLTGGSENLQVKSLYQIAPLPGIDPMLSSLPYLRVIDRLSLFITPSKGQN